MYLKENFKLKNFFSRERRYDQRSDRDYENEILRKKFADGGPDHIELQEENESDEDFGGKNSSMQSRRKVMEFYIDMMVK